VRARLIPLATAGALSIGVIVAQALYVIGLAIIMGRRTPAELHRCHRCNGTGDTFLAGMPHPCRSCFGVGIRVSMNPKATSARAPSMPRRVLRG